MPARPGAARAASLLALPAPQALLIQLAASLPVLGATLVFPGLPLGLAALLQGAFACALSAWRGLPRWWWPIQFAFPLLLLLALAAALPPWLFLLGFVLMLAVFWSTWRTRVPLFLSGPAAWDQVVQLLPPGPVRVLDVGSGLGGLLLHLAARRPEGRYTGIEIAPLPWAASRLRALFFGDRVRLLRGDYARLDFSQCDVVFAYLSPAAMPGLWDKASREMAAGSLLLSYEFGIPGMSPDFTRPCGKRVLYGWRMRGGSSFPSLQP